PWPGQRRDPELLLERDVAYRARGSQVVASADGHGGRAERNETQDVAPRRMRQTGVVALLHVFLPGPEPSARAASGPTLHWILRARLTARMAPAMPPASGTALHTAVGTSVAVATATPMVISPVRETGTKPIPP